MELSTFQQNILTDWVTWAIVANKWARFNIIWHLKSYRAHTCISLLVSVPSFEKQYIFQSMHLIVQGVYRARRASSNYSTEVGKYITWRCHIYDASRACSQLTKLSLSVSQTIYSRMTLCTVHCLYNFNLCVKIYTWLHKTMCTTFHCCRDNCC